MKLCSIFGRRSSVSASDYSIARGPYEPNFRAKPGKSILKVKTSPEFSSSLSSSESSSSSVSSSEQLRLMRREGPKIVLAEPKSKANRRKGNQSVKFSGKKDTLYIDGSYRENMAERAGMKLIDYVPVVQQTSGSASETGSSSSSSSASGSLSSTTGSSSGVTFSTSGSSSAATNSGASSSSSS